MFEGFAVPEYFVWVILLASILYLYLTRNHNYWEKVGIPYIKPWPVVGSDILDFKKRPIQIIDQRRYKKYGRIYGYYEGKNPVLILAEPELLRDVLLKDFQTFPNRRVRHVDPLCKDMLTNLEGEDWKRIRNIVSPTFSTGKIKRIMGIFEACASTLCNNFMKAVEDGKDVNAKELFGAFTMDVIASSAFSTKLDSHNDPNNQFVQTAKSVFSGGISWRFRLATLFPPIKILLKPFQRNVSHFFWDLSSQIIEERKSTGERHNDFLQLLLDAHKDAEEEPKLHDSDKDIDANYLNEGGDEQIINNNYKKKVLSHDELLAQCVIFFLAGYHTTTMALSFASYLLALNPEIQEKAIEEINTVLQENQGELTYEAIRQMKYLDNVISESLRLYPPVFRAERVATSDYILGKTGITVPKGMTIAIPIYAIHRDSEHYPNPDKFDPDRFSNQERAKRQAYTYLPFGGGPRNCVAMRFALVEIKVCLVYVLSRFKMKISSKMKIPLEFNPSLVVMQPKDILLQMETRNNVLLNFR